MDSKCLCREGGSVSPSMQVEAEVMEEEVPGQSSIGARNSTVISKLPLCNPAQYLKTPSLFFFPMLLLS